MNEQVRRLAGNRMQLPFSPAFMVLWLVIPSNTARAEATKHQVTGLFMKEREQDLREAVERIPQVKLVSIDFENAEANFEYDPAKVFPGAKPQQIVERLDNLLKSVSNHTFGIKPLRSAPLEQLRLVEIPVAGLDCKACCLAAYEAVYKLDGVERATASFREGRVTALIDPEKTDRAKLEDALKKRGVQIRSR
jgi:copper chaperone CopZ